MFSEQCLIKNYIKEPELNFLDLQLIVSQLIFIILIIILLIFLYKCILYLIQILYYFSIYILIIAHICEWL
jgi:hypothetical protein